RGAERPAHRGGGLLPAGTDARPVADDLDRDVADGEARLAHELGGRGEELRARGPRPPRVGGAEPGAEVTQTGRGEQRVARGVRGDVAVGVALEADLTRPLETGEEEGPVAVRRGEGVDGGPDPGTRQHASRLVRLRPAAARAGRSRCAPSPAPAAGGAGPG